MTPVHIKDGSIADVWFRLIWELVDRIDNNKPGVRRYKIDHGSFEGQDRLEFDFVIAEIDKPWIRPLLPQFPSHMNLPPIADYESDPQEVVDKYMMDYLISTEKAPGEHYTYGERISISFDSVIRLYKEKGWNTNVPIIQVGRPEDILTTFSDSSAESSTPCLRTIQPRILDGVMSWVIYFRSWDLWSGFPLNISAMQQLKELMVQEIGESLEDGSIICLSPAMHIYDYVETLAYCRLGKDKK